MNPEELFKAREYLVEEFRKELLGPGSEIVYPDSDHEIITDLPEMRYSTGILYPQRNMICADNDIPDIPSQSGMFDDVDDVLPNDGLIAPEDNHTEILYGVNVSEDSDVTTLDDEVGLSTQILPSSMGLTFFITKDTDNISVDLAFGTYRKTRMQDCCLPFTPDYENYSIPLPFASYIEYDKGHSLLRLKSPLSRRDVFAIQNSDKVEDINFIDAAFRLCNQFGRNGYIREPHSTSVTVKFTNSNYAEVSAIDGINLKLTALKKPTKMGFISVTIMLVNENQGKYNGLNSVFQPVITIDSFANRMIFAEYSRNSFSGSFDDEEASLDLLYRNKSVFATGHGTATTWDVNSKGRGWIKTEFMPVSVVAQMDFENSDSLVPSNAFDMYYLSDLDESSKEGKLSALKTIVNSYERWIDTIESESKHLENRYYDAAQHNILECRESLNRMHLGIDTLTKDDIAYSSFVLANRAMYMQRIHTAIQAKESYPDDLQLQEKMDLLDYYHAEEYHPGGKKPAWRPFQLAFLLLSINSIVDPTLPERDLVDLIWFPTGGGKTEAYLGVTAFTIFFRRMKYPDISDGTAVIMRYTLRLLASQQFVRASILICACEIIRKESFKKRKKYPVYSLGKKPITIGLWIGGTHTPNKNTDGYNNAMYHWKKLDAATVKGLREDKDRHNKFQILKCPWCGTKLVRDIDSSGKRLIGKWGYQFKDEKHFYMACPQEGCPFEIRLPIQVVDEELYKNPPTLLFSTVDKFAMMAWKSDVGAFFGSGLQNRAPELIIQDELHLISGPLGTMVGLYEAAVDALCSQKGVRPKIIASTATIRRAKTQCSALYNREVKQFPAPGIDSSDSFFAREASTEKKPGRFYIGIMPAGKTKAMMEVRTISTVLQRVHLMPYEDEIKDKFWTLATYFNSLRDLGKCATLVNDDVKDNIRRMAVRFARRSTARPTGSASELTSRVSTTQLNETLEKLESLTYSAENQKNQKYAIGILLATNMISVGVDVDRLNIMLLVGQPKLTSEYIQASSRIGRTFPGIALTLFDGSKSRDRSHYEQFKAYHDSFYKYVEPTSVTPYSKPARDRALHAVAITLMRHCYGLTKDSDARYFDIDTENIKEINKYLCNRAKQINDRKDIPLADESQDIMEELSDFWMKWHNDLIVANEESFYYGDRYIVTQPLENAKRLIKPFGDGHDDAIETLTSMRNVDQSVRSSILLWGENDD
jgi:hypothetical protein